MLREKVRLVQGRALEDFAKVHAEAVGRVLHELDVRAPLRCKDRALGELGIAVCADAHQHGTAHLMKRAVGCVAGESEPDTGGVAIV